MLEYSIVIPVYNAEKSITRCVESILKNKKYNGEIVLVEDCSTDQSFEICKNLDLKYPNVKLYRNDRNSGVSHTRNIGLKNATGKYILFVDSDDWVAENYVDSLIEIEKNNEDSLIVCGYMNHDEKYNKKLDICVWSDSKQNYNGRLTDILEQLFDRNMLQQLWNKVFLREVIVNNQITFDESISIGEDTRFILEYLKRSHIEKYYILNEPLYHYMRDNPNSLMYKVGTESIEEPLKNIKAMYELMELSEKSIQDLLEKKRGEYIELYSYLIMHNAGMSLRKKKKLIKELGADSTGIFNKQLKIYIKEKLSNVLKG